MKTTAQLILAIGTLALMNACGSAKKTAIMPSASKIEFEDTFTIIWNGKSEAYRYVKGEYVRDDTYDYTFNVIQKRYATQWKSTKTLHRNHPDYNFKAGQRSQSMYFELNFTLEANALISQLKTSLGSGKGKSDIEFREQNFVLDLDKKNAYYNISPMAPYNKIKISQHYNYEAGELLETVELYKEANGKITPFMKNEECATFYIKGKLDKAPTTFKPSAL
jgi:hypothetical protein